MPEILAEQRRERKPSPLAPRAAWRSFSAPETGLEETPAAELLARWRGSHLHTGSRAWSEVDRALAAELDARCWGVAQLSRLKDVRCPRWVEELCFKQTAPSARYPNGRRMHRLIWTHILARFITAFRDGALFVRLDYYEGAADINVSPKTWERAIHEMREAGLIQWERAYVEITDGTRYRDPDTNLYQLGPVLLAHREALLEGTDHPGPAKRRQWEARTLRAAARRARRAREVEARATAESRRGRWAAARPGSRPRRTGASSPATPADLGLAPVPRANTEQTTFPAGDPVCDMSDAANEGPGAPEPSDRPVGSVVASGAASGPCGSPAAASGRSWTPTIVRATDPRPSRPPPLPVKLSSLPAPGPGAVPSARPTAPGANSTNNRERMSSDTPRLPRAAPQPETHPPLPASPAAGSLVEARPSNAGSSSRPTTAADPGLEVERAARSGPPASRGRGEAPAPAPAGDEPFNRSPEARAALAAVEAMFEQRRGRPVCRTCSGLRTIITGFQRDAPRRCPDCT